MTFSGTRTFGRREAVLQSESRLMIDWQNTQIFLTSGDDIGFQGVLSGDIPDGQTGTTSNKTVSRKARPFTAKVPYSLEVRPFWQFLIQNKGRAIPVNLTEQLDTGEQTVFVNARIDDFQRSGHSTTGNDPRYLVMNISYDSLR
jgi:hypothetical protein